MKTIQIPNYTWDRPSLWIYLQELEEDLRKEKESDSIAQKEMNKPCGTCFKVTPQ